MQLFFNTEASQRSLFVLESPSCESDGLVLSKHPLRLKHQASQLYLRTETTRK
jgi:hypothetical protein